MNHPAKRIESYSSDLRSNPLVGPPPFERIVDRVMRRRRKRRILSTSLLLLGLAVIGGGVLAKSHKTTGDELQLVTADTAGPDKETTSSTGINEPPSNSDLKETSVKWRTLANLAAFSSVFQAPTGITDQASLDQAQEAFDLGEIDISKEILVVVYVEEEMRDGKCFHYDADNVRVEKDLFSDDWLLKYDLLLAEEGHACNSQEASGQSYQVLILALERSELPDIVLIPFRSMRNEMHVR